MNKRPHLYSYRRCPYAMRARMALYIAGINVDIEDISFHDKPAHMLAISPKATVPVLELLDGSVIDESLDIVYWALDQHDPENWFGENKNLLLQIQALIVENDNAFKRCLDRYKYADRHPEKTAEEHRQDGEKFLQKLEDLLSQNGFLLADHRTLADVALFPFVRQFIKVDEQWFMRSDYKNLQNWFQEFSESDLFQHIMRKDLVILI